MLPSRNRCCLRLPSRCGSRLRSWQVAAGGLPELDVARVHRWCAGQVPDHIRDEIRVECDVTQDI